MDVELRDLNAKIDDLERLGSRCEGYVPRVSIRELGLGGRRMPSREFDNMGMLDLSMHI